MAIFNDASPADTDAVKAGASQIRGVKTLLNTLLSQIFDDSAVFLPKFVTNTLLAGDPDDANDALRAVGADNIKIGSLTLLKFPTGVFTADAAGRAPFAAGLINSALLDPGIAFPDGSVKTAAIATGAVTTGALAALAATIAKVGAGVAKIAIGTYAGSNSSAVTVTGLAFVPTLLILSAGSGLNQVGLAFKAEASGAGPIHSLWNTGNIGSPFSTAITWNSDGFTVTPSNNVFNDGGITHTYLALAV